MGNALSWVIAKLFGDKEARILILGLDNGACAQARRRCGLLLSFFFSQSVHASLTSQVDVYHSIDIFSCTAPFVRSRQDVHSLPAKGRHLPFHRSKYVPPSAVRGLKDRRLGSRAPFVSILDDRRKPFTPDASHRHMHYRRRANPHGADFSHDFCSDCAAAIGFNAEQIGTCCVRASCFEPVYLPRLSRGLCIPLATD
jgi:hypothetical protein